MRAYAVAECQSFSKRPDRTSMAGIKKMTLISNLGIPVLMMTGNKTLAVAFDLDTYTPFYLSGIANRWTSTSSRTYLRRFGVGIVEWRVLAALAATNAASSHDVVSLIGMDPASVSKAMRALEQRGAVEPVTGRFAGRTKPYRLTADGARLFQTIHEVAREREAALLSGLDAEDRETLLRLLRHLHANLPALSDELN